MIIKFIISCLLFLIAIVITGQNLAKPFWGEHDWNGARYGNIARNYLRYSLVATKLGQVENSGRVSSSEFEYYTHYPPLLPLLITASYKIFGVYEWSTRLIPTIATSASLVFIFLIGSHIWDIKRGMLASLLAMITPMSLYFGKNPVHEPMVLLFILLSFWGYLKSGQSKQKIYKVVFTLGLILAELTAWAGYFLIPSITVVLILRKDKDGLKKIIPYWILSASLFSAHFIHIAILTGSVSGGSLFESLMQRTGISKDIQPEGFNLLGYLLKLRLWFSTLFTITLTLLAILWMVVRKIGLRNNDWPIAVLGILGFMYAIVFTNSVFIHNYLIFYFLPFLSLAGSAAIVYLMNLKFVYFKGKFLPILFLMTIFLERRSFVNALNASDPDKLAVNVGKAINAQTLPADIVLVLPTKFSYSAENFLKFYSDRRLIFADTKKLDYDYIVKVNTEQSTFQISKK